MKWHSARDSLSWSHGHSGKGYLLNDGTVKTWDLDPFNPVDQHQVFMLNHEQSPISLSFDIDPDGGVVIDQPSPKLEQILQADPNLYDAGQRPDTDEFDIDQIQPNDRKEPGPDYNFVMSSEAILPINMNEGCPRCKGPVDDEEGECLHCGYRIPYDGAEQLSGHENYWDKAYRETPGLDQSLVHNEEWGPRHYGGWDLTANSTGTAHFNRWTGRLCHCPWHGTHRQTQRHQRFAGEHINKLKKAPDKAYKTPEGQEFMEHLLKLPEEHESLFPYLAHRFKKGDLRVGDRQVNRWDNNGGHTERVLQLHPYGGPSSPPNPDDEHGWRSFDTWSHLRPWHNWYEARQHPTRRGVNVMDPKFTIEELMNKSAEHQKALQEEKERKEMLALGKTVHGFPGQPAGAIDWDRAIEDFGGMYDHRDDVHDDVQRLRQQEEDPDFHPNQLAMPDPPSPPGSPPRDPGYLENLRKRIQVGYAAPARKPGWHIKHINSRLNDAGEENDIERAMEAEGNSMGHCFTGDTLVRTITGYRPIAEIIPGDEVLSTDGTFVKVERLFEREYDGLLYEITTPASVYPIRVTSEHPFLAMQGRHPKAPDRHCSRGLCHLDRDYTVSKLDDDDYTEIHSHLATGTATRKELAAKYDVCLSTISHVYTGRIRGSSKESHHLDWINAEDLGSRAYIATAVPSQTFDLDYVDVPERWQKLNGKKAATRYELTPEFLWLLGLYLAEGSNNCGDQIQYSLHKKEEAYAQRIEEFFASKGFHVRRRKDPDSYQGLVLQFNSRMLAGWFGEWLGHGCANKHIPAELMNLPNEKLAYVMRGIFDGDGCEGTNELKQTSSMLALQSAEASLRLGGQPRYSIQYKVGKRTVHGILDPGVQERSIEREDYWTALDHTLVRLSGYDSKPYQGRVYNLQVGGDHTYVVQTIGCHNCIGTDEQPYKRNAVNGQIDAYSLRDHKGNPHATWHYNSDGSLAEMFGPNDDDIKPEYQSMLDEWGAKNGKDVTRDEAVGHQEEAEDPYDEYFTFPAAHDVEDYNRFHSQDGPDYDYAHDRGNIGDETEFDNESPNWRNIADDYLGGGNGYLEDFHSNLHSNGHEDEMADALRDRADLDDEDHRNMIDHWNGSIHNLVRHEIELPSQAVNEVNEYNDAYDDHGRPEVYDWDAMAHDYLSYSDHYGDPKFHQPTFAEEPRRFYQNNQYTPFHRNLQEYGNQEHHDEMHEALQRQVNWDDPNHQKAIEYWNKDNPIHNIHPEPESQAPQQIPGQKLYHWPDFWHENQQVDDWGGYTQEHGPGGGTGLPQRNPDPYANMTTTTTTISKYLGWEVISGNWDPTLCANCGGLMGEPHQMGQRWVNTCTNCGSTREVPTTSPLLRNYRQQEAIQPYPQMLQQVGPERAWSFARADPFGSAKTAAETLPQEQRRWQALNETYPSSSRVIHQFPDGWTVQHHPVKRDTWRIGAMMRNCWQGGSNARKDLSPDQYEAMANKSQDHSPLGLGTFQTLHDPYGIPRVAWYNNNGKIDRALGVRNRRPDPQHERYVNDFAHANGIHPIDPVADQWSYEEEEAPALAAPKTSYQTASPLSILSPAVELREWLADLGQGDSTSTAPSIHHDSPEDMVMSPAVSQRPGNPYYPPSHVPDEYKQSAKRLSHQLNFEPGPRSVRRQDWGRGFVRPNGEIHTWPEEYLDHEQMAAKIGDNEAAAPCNSFMIDPRGNFSMHDSVDDNSLAEKEQYIASETGLIPDAHSSWYSTKRQSMAQRSGFPELDAAVAKFMATPHGGEVQGQRGFEGGEIEPEIQSYRDPQIAWGRCEVVAKQCAAFLKQQGFNAYAPSDELAAFDGYQDAQDSAAIGAGDFAYPEHAMVEVYGLYGPHSYNTVTIDFTASQYGFIDEFPKIHPGPSGPLIGPQVESAVKLADGTINQADGTNDPIGKNPSIVPQRIGDPEWIKDSICPHCMQLHKPDEPCPDSSVRQYQQSERNWYRRDPNAIHNSPDGLPKTTAVNSIPNPDKFHTTLAQHERRKKSYLRLNPELPPRQGRADPEWLKHYMKNQDGFMYHSTSPEAAQRIAKEGIYPHDELGTGEVHYVCPNCGCDEPEMDPQSEGDTCPACGDDYLREIPADSNSTYADGFYRPRPGHTYLGNRNYSAHYLKHDGAMFRVNLAKLNPHKMNADEDHFSVDSPSVDRAHPAVASLWENDPPPSAHDWSADMMTLGDWADQAGLGDDEEETHHSIARGSMAYNGHIPPEAMEEVDPNTGQPFGAPMSPTNYLSLPEGEGPLVGVPMPATSSYWHTAQTASEPASGPSASQGAAQEGWKLRSPENGPIEDWEDDGGSTQAPAGQVAGQALAGRSPISG